ncbi:hypothetical protein LSUE1_G007873 [Lachnellula suecica]|uniref:N-acetyltransferase domain-containing protein n=1 Tax=Lachnellula suecica TaxID=602035 RepID=A0A8T9C9E3_9HELO|nr:hypothetical protein LSUE1_G007873 [Lachnellula suecica]
MAPSSITTSLATEEDAPRLAYVMTVAFAATDTSYPLVWGSAAEGTHEKVAQIGLFSPVQKEGRVTIKAVDANEKLVGFATWGLPKDEVPTKKEKEGLPPIPGVRVDLWEEKGNWATDPVERDVDPSKDMNLMFCFVDPEYHRRGIGSLLLQWGTKKADELNAKIWLSSTPQAVSAYEKNGWKVIETHDVMLENYGGEGVYRRAWMLREPATGP